MSQQGGSPRLNFEQARDSLLGYLRDRQAIEDARTNPWDEAFVICTTVSAVHQRRTEQPPCCETESCKLFGAANALWELWNEQRDNPSIKQNESLVEAAKLIQKANAILAAHDSDVASGVENEVVASEGHLRVGSLYRNLQQTIEVAKLIEFALWQHGIEQAEGIYATSFRNRAEPGKKRRPADDVLTAVWKHLVNNGFSHREACVLVPDNYSDPGDDAMVERVRKRVRREVDMFSLR